MSHEGTGRCDRCRFWVRQTSSPASDDYSLGFCHRYPPSVQNEGSGGGAADFWPVTQDVDFCGEFRLKGVSR